LMICASGIEVFRHSKEVNLSGYRVLSGHIDLHVSEIHDTMQSLEE
jgi:hypothetical protein